MDHHDIQAWDSPRRSNRRVIALGVGAALIVGITAAVWTVATQASSTANTPAPITASTPITPFLHQESKEDHTIEAFAVQTTYAYLRLSRDDQDQQVERHKTTLAQVGVDPAIDLGHHPGDGPLGLLPTTVHVTKTAKRDHTTWDVDTITRLGTPNGLTWVSLRIPITYTDNHVNLAGRPRFIPSPTITAFQDGDQCHTGNRELTQQLADPVHIGIQHWLASPQGLNGAFTLQHIERLCITPSDPTTKTTNVEGSVEVVLTEPSSQDTFTQYHPFIATQTDGIWTVSFNPPIIRKHDDEPNA